MKEQTDLILINERHCGPFARPEDAQLVARSLSSVGIAAAYTADVIGLVWSFATRDDYIMFEDAFEEIIVDLTGSAGYWMIDYDEEPARVTYPSIMGSYRVTIEEEE